ncbi:GIY-YIG nuclease family protein [Acaryochloris sp. 'Moss Beach']|uniref:GIY-YIG nuclease family protein n=1 Tax=Acaryochloris sp. 'Moss Beach' TaxID=2740837 RepID=UPI001F483B58|nr:GIY-YIG nuclease family protein [Acaryochloris sp. 'Moss Beach']
MIERRFLYYPIIPCITRPFSTLPDRSLSEVEGNMPKSKGTCRSRREHAEVEGNMPKSEVQQKLSMPYMYILKCADDSYYTGSTWSLKKRLAQHQCGEGARHTARRLPVELVYFEEFARVEDAFRREKQVQGWGRKKKEALMAGGCE